jgi:hypothetical protein
MTRTVLLDAGPLGLLTAPPLRQDARACSQWLAGLSQLLAAQALTLGVPDLVIPTTNVGHLSRFVPAEFWQNIVP